jgi:hypothetical protein
MANSNKTVEFKSNSDAGQDQFAWEILNHKLDGTFLDVGMGHPAHGNNSYALEHCANWSGICIEKNPAQCQLAAEFRTDRTLVLCQDALTVDWKMLLNSLPAQVDFLSLDLDDYPKPNLDFALPFLKQIPLSLIRFSVICFEHNIYGYCPPTVRSEQRDILNMHGYKLVCSDVGLNNCYFEDWWVDPKVVTEAQYKRFICDKTNACDILRKA